MKVLITSLISLLMVAYLSSISLGTDKEINEQKQALQSFETIAAKFKAFFNNDPKFLSKEALSESPTGVTYEAEEYHLIDIAYDVQKTESIVSPFVGYIDLTCTARRNGSCGNVKIKDYTYGWYNIADAFKQIENVACYNWFSASKSSPFTRRFIFAYQNGAWVFKDVIFKDSNKKADQLLAVLGRPSGDFLEIELSGRQYNQPWSTLIDVTK